MRDQHLLAELGMVGRSNGFGGNSRKVAVTLAIGGAQNEGHERGTRLFNFQSELAGKIVSETGCTHLPDGESPGSDNERWRAEFVFFGANDELGCARNFTDPRVQENLNTRSAALCLEHVEN